MVYLETVKMLTLVIRSILYKVIVCINYSGISSGKTLPGEIITEIPHYNDHLSEIFALKIGLSRTCS